MPETSEQSFRDYNFKIEMGGETQGHFARCSKIGARIKVIQARGGGEPHVVHNLPGPVEFAHVTLQWGLTSSRRLWDWFQSVMEGKLTVQNVSIVMLGTDGVTEVTRWNLRGAWPCEWNGPELDALGQGIAIESITLAFESMSRG